MRDAAQLCLLASQLRVVGERVDEGGMPCRLEEGREERFVPALSTEDGGILGVEGGRGGRGAFEVGSGERWHEEGGIQVLIYVWAR